MSITDLAVVNEQIQEFWSPTMVDDLKENTLLPGMVNRDYDGDIEKGGDTVKVSLIRRPTAQRKTTTDPGGNTFNTQALSTSQIEIVANQRISAAYEFEDLVDLQSQIGDENSKIRQGLVEATEIELNNFLYSLVAPSAATPDHVITGVTDFNASQLNSTRTLAAQAHWRKQEGWWLLADPVYFGDLLNATTMTSSDFVPDAPVVAGQIARQRFGFNILEDDSEGLLSLSGSSADAALAFHEDFLALVMQKMPSLKVSDLHPQGKFGFVISIDMIVGASLLPDGDLKHITIINS